MVTSGDREQCLSYAKENYQIAHSRACNLFNCSRKNKYYHKRMPLKDEPIEKAIRDVIGNSRKGRKKVIALIRKKRPELGVSKIRRVYHLKGFALMKRFKTKMRNNPKNPAIVPMQPNIEWAIDFMHDALVEGRRFRSLNIIDPYNRECKGIYIRHNLQAVRVIELLDQSIEKYGKPRYIRSDNGPEFISKLFQKWMHDNGIGWSRIEKGKPEQNCHVERFNKTVREDFFDANLFFSINQANEMAADFQKEYNYERPHESLNDLTPMEYAA
jgi:putative transposase